MRKLVLRSLLIFFFFLSPPAFADEGLPFEWPSFDWVEWIVWFWEAITEEELPVSHLEDEPREIGPAAEPWG